MNTKGKSSKVKVWVRVRPTSNFAHGMIDLQSDNKTINLHCPREAKKGVVNNQILDWSFKVDGVLHNATQEQVFDTVATDMVTAALDGYNGTLMCYGQTGAGKTFTMTGATENYQHRGLVPRALHQVYKDIDERPEDSITIRISYLEIYNETMSDLLSTVSNTQASPGNPMTVVEESSGVYVKGLSYHLAPTEEDALNLLFEGETNRAIAAHSLNKQSSRSHCIFTIYVETRSRVASNARYTTSKLNMVDLAGSERLSKTRSEGATQQEAMYINKSLTFLEQTVIALADRKRDHIPYRQTKLTHCLKDSIGGGCRTMLIANIWGEQAQIEETISTLRFATRMMCVANEPSVNEQYDPSIMVKRLEKEIAALKHELAMHDTLTNRSLITYDPLSEQQKYEIKQQVRKYVDGSLDEIDIVNIRQIQGVFDSFREICQQMEKDLEGKLKEKYILIDRSDPQQIAEAQRAGAPIADDGTLVGETDRQGFGVGTAPASEKAAQSAIVNAKKRDAGKRRSKGAERAAGASSPTKAPGTTSREASAKHEREAPTPVTISDRKEERDIATPASSQGIPIAKPSVEVQRPSTPPLRKAAFEEFKQERGSEINRILTENKEILATKKKQYSQLAKRINKTKYSIDTTCTMLDNLRMERPEQDPTMSEEGETVITEEEFINIKKLKELKSTYRADHEEFKTLKSEVQYCQKLVEQCRQKLVQEFDNWYSESFLSPDAPQTSIEAGLGVPPGVQDDDEVPEDEQEKFDRLQMELLLENPESAAFYNAKMRTERRKIYESAMSQSQPTMNKRRPGTPKMTVRNKPPSMLESY